MVADDPITRERLATATQFVAEIRALDDACAGTRARTAAVVATCGTTVTNIHGIGPIAAAIILGHTGDVRRFPSGTTPATTAPPPSKRPPVRRPGTGSTPEATGD